MTDKIQPMTPSRSIFILTNSKGEAWFKPKGIKIETVACRCISKQYSKVFEGRALLQATKSIVLRDTFPQDQPQLQPSREATPLLWLPQDRTLISKASASYFPDTFQGNASIVGIEELKSCKRLRA